MIARSAALALVLSSLGGCAQILGIEEGRLADGGLMDAPEDRGTGVTESGVPCTCVPTPPAGWKLVALEIDGTDECPVAYGMKTQVVEGTAPPAQCTCQCGPPLTQGSCTATSVTVQTGTGGQCTGTSATASVDAGCAVLGLSGPAGQITWIKGTAVVTPTTQGNCGGGTVEKVVPPITNPHTDVRCTLTGGTGFGCQASDTCVPNVSGAFKMCIEGQVGPCPAGWTEQHDIGTGRTDSSDCTNGCNCNHKTTCSTEGISYKNDLCTSSNNFTFDLDGTCVSSNIVGLQTTALKVTTTATTTCTPGGAATPTGVSKLDNPTVVCCR
jgi:hypothetical protein